MESASTVFEQLFFRVPTKPAAAGKTAFFGHFYCPPGLIFSERCFTFFLKRTRIILFNKYRFRLFFSRTGAWICPGNKSWEHFLKIPGALRFFPFCLFPHHAGESADVMSEGLYFRVVKQLEKVLQGLQGRNSFPINERLEAA
jgi:hypothetical protein